MGPPGSGGGSVWAGLRRQPGSPSVQRLAAAPSAPAAEDVVRSNVCACVWLCQAFIFKDEGVAFKNNIFLT